MSRAEYSWRVALQQSSLPLPRQDQYAKRQGIIRSKRNRRKSLTYTGSLIEGDFEAVETSKINKRLHFFVPSKK
jgi:hypothetical protein